MKVIKRTAMLALMLVMILMAACGGSNGGGTNDGTSDNGSANNRSTDNGGNAGANNGSTDEGSTDGGEGDEAAPQEEKFDLGGREIRISAWWDQTPKADTEEGEKMLERIKRVEEKYNVKITFLNTDYWETANKVSSTVLAGEPFAEIVNLPDGFIWGLLAGGFLTPLSDYIDFANESVLPPDLIEAMKFGTNKVWAFYPPYAPNMTGLIYNKTLFEEAGLKTPQQLMDEDNWNWDTFLDAAIKLTKDKNGDGTIDQYGVAVAHYMIAPYLVFSNEANYYDEANRKVVFDSPNAMEAFNFMYDLYNKHKVIKPNEGDPWNDPSRYFAAGEVAMYPGGTWEMGPRIGADVIDWGYVYLPKGPKATQYVDPMTQAVGIVIPKGVEDPRAVYLIWQDLQDFEGAHENRVAWAERTMPDEPSMRNVLNLDGKMKQVFGRYGGLGIQDALYPITEGFITGAETPASGIAKVVAQAQAKVDEILASVQQVE